MSGSGEAAGKGRPLWLLALLYAVSGAAALMVETTWMRWFRLLLGATAPAASATLVGFFAGHALGALFAGRRAARWRRPLLAYGAIELVAVAGALWVPLGLAAGQAALSAAYDSLRGAPALLAAARFGLALCVGLPAAFCFGATLPAIGSAALPARSRLGDRGAWLYGVNTLGAACGAALAAFVLPDRIGVRATYGVALVALAGVGALAVGLGRDARVPPADAPAAPRPAPDGALAPRRITLLAGFSGFGAFATQVLLVHAFAQVLNQSVYAFGSVLVVVLVALALGALATAVVERRGLAAPRRALAASLALCGLLLAAYPALLHAFTGGLDYVGGEGGGLAYLARALGTVAATAGPALLAGALAFPLCFALAARTGEDAGGPGRALGALAAANTAGAIAGALAAPYLLMPALGLWPAFGALGACYAAAALAVPATHARERIVRDGALALAWVTLLALASPLDVAQVGLLPGERVLDVRTSPSGLVAVVERDGERLIRTDNHYALGGTAETVHEERQGHVPLLLHPAPRRVAFVGAATGISAGAALAHPVERLHLVEIVPEVVEAARAHFDDANRGVYDDPRTRVVLDDARNFLRSTELRFDVIVADLFVPWRSGTGALYTREHFQAVRERLDPGGVFCQWLPLYQLGEEELRVVAATFLSVFPRTAVFRGDFYGRFPIVALVGFRDAPPTAGVVGEAVRRLAAAGERDRWVTDPLGFWSLYVAPLGPWARALADVPHNRDDRPRIEYLAARRHAGGQRGKLDPLVGLAWARLAGDLRQRAHDAGGALWPDLPPAARRAVEGGAALQAAGAFYVEGREPEAARALEAAAERIPDRLLRDASADPTAAEVWW